MTRYQNGDRCPCCGGVIEGKTEEWLEVFSQLCHATGLEVLEEPTFTPQPLDPIDFPPPDAGINPPVKPKL